MAVSQYGKLYSDISFLPDAYRSFGIKLNIQLYDWDPLSEFKAAFGNERNEYNITLGLMLYVLCSGNTSAMTDLYIKIKNNRFPGEEVICRELFDLMYQNKSDFNDLRNAANKLFPQNDLCKNDFVWRNKSYGYKFPDRFTNAEMFVNQYLALDDTEAAGYFNNFRRYYPGYEKEFLFRKQFFVNFYLRRNKDRSSPVKMSDIIDVKETLSEKLSEFDKTERSIQQSGFILFILSIRNYEKRLFYPFCNPCRPEKARFSIFRRFCKLQNNPFAPFDFFSGMKYIDISPDGVFSVCAKDREVHLFMNYAENHLLDSHISTDSNVLNVQFGEAFTDPKGYAEQLLIYVGSANAKAKVLDYRKYTDGTLRLNSTYETDDLPDPEEKYYRGDLKALGMDQIDKLVFDKYNSCAIALTKGREMSEVLFYIADWGSLKLKKKYSDYTGELKYKNGMPTLFPDDYLDDVSPEETETENVEPEKPVEKKTLSQLYSENEDLKKSLSEQILGQDSAVTKFCNAIFNSQLFDSDDEKTKKPRAILTFAGPPGVGKTMLAEMAAKMLGKKVLKMNMGDYNVENAVESLSRFEYTWKDAVPGALTDFVRRYPDGVLIFDEIEKATPKVHKLFLSMLDRAELTDKYYNSFTALPEGTKAEMKAKSMESEQRIEELEKISKVLVDGKVSFKDTIIIFTTNVGEDLYRNKTNLRSISDRTIIGAIRDAKNPDTGRSCFPPEFVSRLASGKIIMFDHLKSYDLLEIEKKVFEKYAGKFKDSYGLGLHIGRPGKSDENNEDEARLLTALLLSMGGKSDARRTEAFIRTFIMDQLKNVISDPKHGSLVTDIYFKLGLSGASPEIRELFIADKNNKQSILVYSSKSVFDIIEEKCREEIDVFHAESSETALAYIAKKDICAALVDIRYSPFNKPEKPNSTVFLNGAKK